jgi:hypothetical protein
MKSTATVASPLEYRRFADECLIWANKVHDQRHRNMLLEIAKTWMQTALQIDQAHERPPRSVAPLGQVAICAERLTE